MGKAYWDKGKIYPKVCPYCKEEFVTEIAPKRYCGDVCRERNRLSSNSVRRQRKKEQSEYVFLDRSAEAMGLFTPEDVPPAPPEDTRIKDNVWNGNFGRTDNIKLGVDNEYRRDN